MASHLGLSWQRQGRFGEQSLYAVPPPDQSKVSQLSEIQKSNKFPFQENFNSCSSQRTKIWSQIGLSWMEQSQVRKTEAKQAAMAEKVTS